MQATNKTHFNIPGGGWIAIEYLSDDAMKIETEGRAAGLLASQIKNRGMDYKKAVSHCKYCLKSEKEILQETIEQQQAFVNFCDMQIAVIGTKSAIARNDYEALIGTAKYEIRLAERRLKTLK